MPKPAARFRHILVFIGLLIFAGLACNAPTNEPDPDPDPAIVSPSPDAPEEEDTPVVDPEPTEEPPPPQTLPAVVTQPPTATASHTPEPTSTPAGQPTLAQTKEPSRTPTRPPQPTSPPVIVATATSAGPLKVEYQITWRLDPSNPTKAIATVTVVATGGAGDYTYYIDDVITSKNPVMEFEWAACSEATRTLKVESADGQVVSQPFSSPAICPTPTPQT